VAAFKLLFLFLMGGGVPVAIAMAGSALLYVMISGNVPDYVVIHRMVGGLDSFVLLAVPFFIFAGNLMNTGGITNRIYNWALAIVGWLRGGLGHVNVVGSVVFAGMSGTAIADASGLGTIEIKAMREHGYSAEFAVGVTAASATIGPIIPPSLPFIIYALFANVSIGALFIAGILPGIVMAILMMLMVAYFARRYGFGADVPFVRRRFGLAVMELAIVVAWPFSIWGAIELGADPKWAAIGSLLVLLALDWRFRFQAVLPILTPVLLIGGMRGGIFTATEAAIAACVWALFLGLVWYRSMRWKQLARISMDTIETTAAVLFIVAAASIFGWMLTATRTTELIASWVLALTQDKHTFLLMANLLMLFVGCFLEPTAAITILVPLLLPIARQLGIDPIHFGLVMVLNLMIGLLHPPVGLVLFVLARIARLSVERTTVAILPWLIPLFLSLILITYVPSVSLWLPSVLH
jgi:TRAP-type C4-dicarboxylate transport system permease large subunit